MSTERGDIAADTETEPACDGVKAVVRPRRRDLGGFTVGRVLPAAKNRMVGPFIFFDVIGPAVFKPGAGINVRPHPHIGLATITYLFDGEIRHRDSLGFDQVIRPGDVNWMTAGRGIVHSERTDPSTRAAGHRLYGIQSWIALPTNNAETDPSFHHHPKQALPVFSLGGATARLIAGEAYGRRSPVETMSALFYLAIESAPGARFDAPTGYAERAIYLLEGSIEANGSTFNAGELVVFEENARIAIKTTATTKAMLLGGANLGPRRIWWNLVASDMARIDKAKADWRGSAAQGFRDTVFRLPVGETEYIPLPDK